MSLSEQQITWVRSSRCDSSACTEIAYDGDHVLVRSSERPTEIARLTYQEWADLRHGDFTEGTTDVPK